MLPREYPVHEMLVELFLNVRMPLAAHLLAIKRTDVTVILAEQYLSEINARLWSVPNVIIFLQVIHVSPRLETMNLPLRCRGSTRVNLG